ncbi:DUF4160 domain-containing protein [Leptolyngbya sp. CCNP1308]|uniref:DUF4160 domain-containing protein n=1 Tax=Leptolyngbya sp. CCNP1308 TaxID=3110255 RepID=UPI002B214EBE|nr:DUF4160 domain-containing protein [Leptolyngbya sp. CCNP1308]MEA5450762.1 DUF4160 domain-containing protein [Leptolyngbya sp. CCNP1308]
MPTLLRVGPYRFFCYAGDRDEPPHVHIERDSSEAKFWLTPVRLQFNKGFSSNEINRIQKLTEENQQQLLEAWHDFFNG